MGWLKKMHDSLEKNANDTNEFIKRVPYIAVCNLPLSAMIDEALAKVIERGTEDYVLEGKKQGYAEASDEYERKLLNLADKFTKEKDAFQKERNEYEDLLDEFDKKIQELQEKNNKSQQEIELLNQLLLKERELKKLRD